MLTEAVMTYVVGLGARERLLPTWTGCWDPRASSPPQLERGGAPGVPRRSRGTPGTVCARTGLDRGTPRWRPTHQHGLGSCYAAAIDD